MRGGVLLGGVVGGEYFDERGRRLVGVQPLAPQPRSEGEDVV